MDDLNAYPDVALVRARARRDWERQARKTVTVQERIGRSVPWWLVLIALVFFALSAPHTAGTFDKLTPGWGWVAPVGVEFGLLYAAFRRRQMRGQIPLTLWALEALLFVTAVIVNGAGAFSSVVAAAGISDLPFNAIVGRYHEMPATSQVALVLVPLSAFIIPIGTGVAGEGLAALFLERRQQGSLMEERWHQVAPEMEFLALRDAAMSQGIKPREAIRWAAQITGYGRPALSAADTSADNRTPDRTVRRDPVPRHGGQGTGQGYTKAMDARERVRKYLEENPDAADLSVRDLASATGIGKTVAADVRREFRRGFSSNGHHKE